MIIPTEAERTRWKTDPDAAYAEALRRVEGARRTGAERLILSGDVGDNSVGALPALARLPLLHDLPKVTTVDLGNTQVADIKPLEGLTALQALRLNNTQVADLMPIRGLARLSEKASERRSVNGLYYLGTPVADRAAFTELVTLDQPDRSVETLQYLNGEHPVHGGPPEDEPPIVPDMPTEGTVVIAARFDGKRLSTDGSAPDAAELEMLFGILKREADDLGDYGSLHNVAKPTAIALERYTAAIPEDYAGLDSMGQIRLGVEGKLLGTKYGGERSMLEAEFPEKTGVIDALLVAHDLLVDRLASYQDFLNTTEKEPALTEAQETTIIENVDLIAEEWEKDPDAVDPAIPETLYGLRHAVHDVAAAGHAILRGLYDVVRSVLVWVKTELADIASGTWEEFKPGLKKDLARVMRVVTLSGLGELALAIPWFGERIGRGLEFLKQLGLGKDK